MKSENRRLLAGWQVFLSGPGASSTEGPSISHLEAGLLSATVLWTDDNGAFRKVNAHLPPGPLPKTAALYSALFGAPPLTLPLARALHFRPVLNGGGSFPNTHFFCVGLGFALPSFLL